MGNLFLLRALITSHLSLERADKALWRKHCFQTKVPEPPTFAGSENKIHLYDWLSQIALYCSVSGIILDNQKIICVLTHLHTPTSTYMKSYYNKVEAGLSIGSWGDFA